MKRHALWLPLLALTTTILMLAYAARKPEPSQATLETVQAEARSGGYRLITTEELWGWFQSKAKANAFSTNCLKNERLRH